MGERSLVSLARALVKDAQIVVLDEATASVDFETVRIPSALLNFSAYLLTYLNPRTPRSSARSRPSSGTRPLSQLLTGTTFPRSRKRSYNLTCLFFRINTILSYDRVLVRLYFTPSPRLRR